MTDRTWSAIYVDSPETLAPKLALANDRGLAGAGFWAIGYERGLPGYRELMDAFTSGDALPWTALRSTTGLTASAAAAYIATISITYWL